MMNRIISVVINRSRGEVLGQPASLFARRGRAMMTGPGSLRHFAERSGSALISARRQQEPEASSRAGGSMLRRGYSQTVGWSHSSSAYPPHSLLALPALSPTMSTGTIASWNKQAGDAFTAGDVLCTIETDKASVDFESQDEGLLAKILQPAGGAEIAIGTPICVVVESGTAAEVVAAFAHYQLDTSSSSSSAATLASSSTPALPESSAAAPSTTTTTGGQSNLLMPSARHLSESKGVDATGLAGSGKGGRVTKADVMAALASGVPLPPLAPKAVAAAPSVASLPTTAAVPTATPPAAVPRAPVSSTLQDLPPPTIETPGPFEEITNSKMRKIIAKRLTESMRDVPHFYTSMEVELDQVMALRQKLVKEYQVKVSVNDFVIRCCALSLRDVPEVNGTFVESTSQWQLHDSIDISVAVATPTGLITPIVFGTDRLGLADITRVVKDLAGRAREGKLAPQEYQGGTFSVSNLGMFGIDEFSAVINPPQAAILAVGGGSRRVVPGTAAPRLQTLMTARLSADRRVVDEATAALFLSAFRQYMNQPTLLLL